MNYKKKNKILKCGIIGCGKIAGGYDSITSSMIRTHAKAFKENERCELVSVYDDNLKLAQKFAKYWNVTNCHIDISDLLDQKLDIISICTPTDTHKKIYEKVILSKPPIIWLEKPSANTTKDIRKMIEICSNETVVWVNYFRKYMKEFIELKKNIKNLGSIQNIQMFYTKGIQNNGSHLIDLILFLFGEINVVKINSIFKREEYLDADVMFESKGISINLKSLDYKKFELFEIDIIGSQGRVQITSGGAKIKYSLITKSLEYSDYNVLKKNYIRENNLTNFMSQGLDFGIKGYRKNDLVDDLKVQKIVEQILSC